MSKTKIIKLEGPWDEGFALDIHTISSELIGYDPYGNPIFDNQYSEIGQLLNSFKYRNDYKKLERIIELIRPFITTWEAMKHVDIVLPAPSSRLRSYSYQPVEEIAHEIANLINAHYLSDILIKESSMESKGLSAEEKHQLQGTIVKTRNATTEHNMLLVDDIYDTGATLIECANILREDPKISRIFVLTLTRTRIPK